MRDSEIQSAVADILKVKRVSRAVWLPALAEVILQALAESPAPSHDRDDLVKILNERIK